MSGWDELNSIGSEVAAAAREAVRETVEGAMYLTQDLFLGGARVKTGRFRGSFEAYRGTPPDDEGKPEGQPFYSPPGHDQIDATMAGWDETSGEELGFVDQVPYAEVLANRADSKGTEGWLDLIAEAARGATR